MLDNWVKQLEFMANSKGADLDGMLVDVPRELYRAIGSDSWNFLLDLLESSEGYGGNKSNPVCSIFWCLERLSRYSNGFDMGVLHRCEKLIHSKAWPDSDIMILLASLSGGPIYYHEDAFYSRLSALCEWFLGNVAISTKPKGADFVPPHSFWLYSRRTFEFFPRFSNKRKLLMNQYYTEDKIVISHETLSSIFKGPDSGLISLSGLSCNEGAPFIEGACYSTTHINLDNVPSGISIPIDASFPAFDCQSWPGDPPVRIRYCWVKEGDHDRLVLKSARFLLKPFPDAI